MQLACALKRLGHDGTGASVFQLAREWGIGTGTDVEYTDRACKALVDLAEELVQWRDEQERKEISKRILQSKGFPGCVGFVDGSHVVLSQKPAVDGETFFNRKQAYSYNVQAICDGRRQICHFPG